MREGVGGTSNILQSSLKLLLLMTIGFGKFFWSCQIQQLHQCFESIAIVH
jgi:hypothetical protein